MNLISKNLSGIAVLMISGLTLGLGIGGCTTIPVTPAEESIVVTGNPNLIWSVCQEQVKARGFRLDLVDRRRGIITGFPLVSRKWFEFWCQDVVTGEDLLESSLQTVRRIMHLEMKEVGHQQYELYCRVAVERLSSERQIVAGRVRAQEIFSRTVGNIPALGGGGNVESEPEQWLPIGEDRALATNLVQSIRDRITKR